MKVLKDLDTCLHIGITRSTKTESKARAILNIMKSNGNDNVHSKSYNTINEMLQDQMKNVKSHNPEDTTGMEHLMNKYIGKIKQLPKDWERERIETFEMSMENEGQTEN